MFSYWSRPNKEQQDIIRCRRRHRLVSSDISHADFVKRIGAMQSIQRPSKGGGRDISLGINFGRAGRTQVGRRNYLAGSVVGCCQDMSSDCRGGNCAAEGEQVDDGNSLGGNSDLLSDSGGRKKPSPVGGRSTYSSITKKKKTPPP